MTTERIALADDFCPACMTTGGHQPSCPKRTDDETDAEVDGLYADLAYVETFLETAALTPTDRRVYAMALREIRRRIAEAGGDPNA